MKLSEWTQELARQLQADIGFSFPNPNSFVQSLETLASPNKSQNRIQTCNEKVRTSKCFLRIVGRVKYHSST